MKSKLEIYALAVCFAAVVCLVVSIGIAGYSIVQIINPELTINSYKYEMYQTNDRFWESKKDKSIEKKPSNEELTKQRQEAFQVEIRGEKREGFQTLIKAFMFIVVGAITLLLHWQIAKKARAGKA